MVSDFLLLQSRLNLLSLSFKKQEKLVNSGVPKETVIYFEYGKSEEEYQTGEYLLDQIIKKALPIRKALYLGYALLFLFDNIISHSIYIQNVV